MADNNTAKMASFGRQEDMRRMSWSKLLSMRYFLRYGHPDPYWESELQNV